MATEYRIYPPIGFARVGNSASEFIIAREQLGVPETQVDATGAETPVSSYKTSPQSIKPVAARFRVFAVPDDGTPPFIVDAGVGATVHWTVEVANRKNGVNRTGGPPNNSSLPVDSASGAASRILPGPKAISGANVGPVSLDGGTFQGVAVALGQLRTDSNQNLLVIGASGSSSSPTGSPISNFYNNSGWHDDSCDGVVRAHVTLSDGTAIVNVAPAWVVSGPPDYAPDVEGLVTLYDIMREVARQNFSMPLGAVSFTKDIYPIIRRANNLQWVNSNPLWASISTNWALLSDTSAAASMLRQTTRNQIIAGAGSLNSFQLTVLQTQILQSFASGTFSNDWAGVPASTGLSPSELTRVALDSTVGQGFFPGIEAGRVTQNPSIYSHPFEFRLDASVVKPGDLTALMAVPWQADFLACSSDWWPSQRPNDVQTGVGAGVDDWSRGVNNFAQMVGNYNRLGFVVPQVDGAGNTVLVEQERDPGL